MENTSKSNIKNINFRNTAKAMAVAASMPIVAVPIQEVQLLDYAVAHETVNATYGLTASTDDDIYLGLMDKDPYTSDQQRERDEYEINDRDWNEVVFEEVYGGSTAKLALHNDWINQKGYQVDAVVQMNLPEQGISGPFRITSIKHIIPQKKPTDEDEADEYSYRPVTALFTHESSQVYDISFDNGESLGVTYQHPIFSTTAGDWRLAGELEIGEEVLTKSGNTKVVSSTKKGGSETVYNLEVQELHNFLVGEGGVVVHNSCIDEVVEAAEKLKIRKALKDGGIPEEALDEVMEEFAQVAKDEVIKQGKKLSSGSLSNAIRIAWKAFEELPFQLFLQALIDEDIDLPEDRIVEQVTLKVDGKRVVLDYIAVDFDGNLHLGEAKYSTEDVDWDNDWNKTTTPNQKHGYPKLIDKQGVVELRVTKPEKLARLQALGLSHGEIIDHSRIKTFKLFGSAAGKSNTLKKMVKLIF